MLRKIFLAAVVLGGVHLAAAAHSAEPDLSQLQAALGGVNPDSVSPASVPGLYEVVIGSQVLYLTEDGQFAIQGDVIDLSAGKNLTEVRRDQLRLQTVDDLGEDNMVVYSPDKAPQHTITVFTDIDCPYCRRMHQEMAELNQSGIKVRYLLYPRAGIGSESYDKAVAVWCSADRQDALTRAKQGKDIGRQSCPNPVQTHYQLGQQLGIRGTPSIILDSGEMVPGYVPAPRLVQMLDGGSGG